jgi:hypothetical protein
VVSAEPHFLLAPPLLPPLPPQAANLIVAFLVEGDYCVDLAAAPRDDSARNY